MPVIQAEARVSPEQLLRAVDEMSPDELSTFTQRVIELRARRVASVLSTGESMLLERVNRTVASDRRARYDELSARREAESLTPTEYAELLTLSDESESLDADRVAAIAELARLRGVSLDAMMTALGVPDRR
jgi:hypothetical protein